MPIPLRPREDIYVDYKELPGSYAMPTMEAAFDHYAIGYTLSGDRKYFTHEKVYYSHGKSIGFALPYIYHRNMPVSESNVPYNRFLIKYRKEVLQPVIDLIGENEFMGLHLEYLKFTDEDHVILQAEFEKMLAVYNSHSLHSQFMLKNMLQNLVLTIHQKKLPLTGETIHLNTFNEQIYEAMLYIEHNLASDLSLSVVARSVSLSPSHFSRLFKASVGCSFSEYVTTTRLQCAKVLLANENLSVSEIALRTGFNNSNYFSTIFKKYNGVSPRGYGQIL